MNSAKPAKITKKELVTDIQKLNLSNPGNITRDFYRQNVTFPESAWQKYFPKFDDFLKAAKITFDDLSTASQAKILALQAKAENLEKVNKALLKERGKFSEMVDELKSVVIAADPYPRGPILIHPASKTPVSAVVKLSDWQIGEVIAAAETEGFGEFNFAIAEKRVFKLVEKVLAWVDMHRKGGYNLRELHLFSEADLVSGNIHYELEVTNEFPVTMAAAKAGRLLAEVIQRFAAHFDKVTVWEMSADNHGRMTRKNQGKQGAINNWSYMAHTICNEIVRDTDNVETIMGDGTKLLANVCGKKFLLCHGHHIMGQMGIPYYGMGRDKAREAVKRAHFPDLMFDYISMGHWHVPAIIEEVILVNGNLPGTTEFDHMQGRHAKPQQVSFMVHPEHGLFNWTAWKL